MTFRKQLNLFVVGMARDRARVTNPSGSGTSQAEVDGLSDVAFVVSALGESVREGKGSLTDEFVL